MTVTAHLVEDHCDAGFYGTFGVELVLLLFICFQEDFEEENWSKLGGEVIFISLLLSSTINQILIICVTMNVFTSIIKILIAFVIVNMTQVITVELEQNNYGLGLSLAGAKVDNHDHYCHRHVHDHHFHDDDEQDRDIMRTYICGLHPRGIASTSGKLQAGDQLLKVLMMM